MFLRSTVSFMGFLWLLLLVGCGTGTPPSGGNDSESSAASTAFTLLRSHSEPLPASVANQIVQILPPGLQFKPLDTQRVALPRGPVWIFLTDHQLCLTRIRFGIACVPQQHALTAGVSLGTFSPPSASIPRLHHFVLLGLAPDGIHSVLVLIGRGSTARLHRLPVHNNLFQITSERPIHIRTFLR
jgi:hypothetical protein